MAGDPRILHAPAAERNRTPILDVLRRVLPSRGLVLEVASGTGQHITHFAAALPALDWQPSDPDPRHRASIVARVAAAGLNNVRPPLDLDVLSSWPTLSVAAVIAANLLHVAPEPVLQALCEGAAAVCRPGSVLHVYGPFNRNGAFTSVGNARFDASLRQQNPALGIRDLETVIAAADSAGFKLREVVDMPANNLAVVLEKG